MADEEQVHTNHIYQVLKAVGDNIGTIRSDDDARNIALRVPVRIDQATLDAELFFFGDRPPFREGAARLGFVIQDGRITRRGDGADFEIAFVDTALMKASPGYKAHRRVILRWKRTNEDSVELVGAVVTSDLP